MHGTVRFEADGKEQVRGPGETTAVSPGRALTMAVLMRECDAEMQLARSPAVVQRALFAPIALVGRTLGYRGWYPRYTTEPMPRVR